jgi:glucose/arabinose dehydrogenase
MKAWHRRPRIAVVVAIAAFAVVTASASLALGSSSGAPSPAGGAPPPGSGTIDFGGFVRVIDGDTIEVDLGGNRIGIRLVGLAAPAVNTPCGLEASAHLESLLGGGILLKEEKGFGYTESGLRYYRGVTRSHASVALAMIRAGFAKASGDGSEAARLARAQKRARAGERGCLWGELKGFPVSEQGSGSKSARGRALQALANLPSGFTEELVASGLNGPTSMVFLPDGRILISLKEGTVRVFKNGALLSTPFIDIRNKVSNYWDRGLLGIGVPPDFATSQEVYLLYTYENDATNGDGQKTGRLARYIASGDTASPSTETVILGSQVGAGCGGFTPPSDCLPNEGFSHAIGSVNFGADGTVWVTNGDAASYTVVDDQALRAQSVDSLAGKVIHVSRTGQGLPSNPFWDGNAGSARSKVWAYGLRNPYRFNLSPFTGIPFLGDVGWNTTEEVDSVPSAVNLGWPCYEGTPQQGGYAPKATCQALYAQGASAVRTPLDEWGHAGGSSAATGGTFYTGTVYPAQYQGAYFYADYGQGWIRYLKVDANNNRVGAPVTFATGANGPVDIEMGPDGYLYVLQINNGTLLRLKYNGTPPPPPPSGTSYLSDLTPTSSSNGWGPIEKDLSNGEQAAGDGHTITLAGVTYSKGLGAHANSDVKYALGSGCTRFKTDYGIDDEVGGSNGSVVFQVWLDGAKAYESASLNGSSPTGTIDLDITGKQQLQLVLSGGADVNYDHADWAGARIECGSGSQAPTVTSLTPGDASTGVAVNSNATATFSVAMNASTITGSTFTLTKQGATQAVAAAVTYDAVAKKATLDPTSDLEQGATYVARVVGGANGVKGTDGTPLAADKQWTFTTAGSGGTGTTVFLSDRTWTSMTNGWGPAEKDRSNGENAAGDGGTLTLNGVTYTKGLGTHAASDIRYTIDPGCTRFKSDFGLDDEVGANGSLIGQVWLDGVKVYESATLTGASATVAVDVDISGKQELRLVVDGGGSIDSDHADWANARMECSGGGGNTPPTLTIASPLATDTFKVGDLIQFSGSATDTEDGGNVPDNRLSWEIILHHCPGGDCHPHPSTTVPGPSGSLQWPDHGDEVYLELKLTATDSQGLAASKSVNIQPKTVQVTLQTVPAGLQLTYGGKTVTAPATFTSIQGGSTTLTAPTSQSGLTFSSWSDGGAAQHNITIPTSNVTYTATYTGGGGGTPPTVTSTVPASGATGVAGGANITATFSIGLTASTVNATTFTLTKQGTSVPVSGVVTYDAATKIATLNPTPSLDPGATYTAKILSGVSGVKATDGTPLAADKTWSFTIAAAGTSYLSDRTWTSATNGWGPVEKDKSNGEQAAGDGTTIKLNGVSFTKGLGAHAVSDIRYALGGTCSTFLASVGIDDEVGANGRVVFQVYGDTVKLYDSGYMTGSTATKAVNVSIAGRTTLRLVVTDGANGIGNDHADWADARITCTS